VRNILGLKRAFTAKSLRAGFATGKDRRAICGSHRAYTSLTPLLMDLIDLSPPQSTQGGQLPLKGERETHTPLAAGKDFYPS